MLQECKIIFGLRRELCFKRRTLGENVRIFRGHIAEVNILDENRNYSDTEIKTEEKKIQKL